MVNVTDPPEPPPQHQETEIQIRPATRADADNVGDVYLAAFRATYAFPLAHSDDEVREWLAGAVAGGSVWLAVAPVEGEDRKEPGGMPDGDERPIVGIMRLVGHELDQLYVAPGWWARGIGSRLLDLAKAHSPEGLALWTFQVNERARRFYERHGFVVAATTDGAGNEERQPDVRYAWRPDVGADRTWDAVYAGTPPWDIGRPQSAFRALAEAGELRGRVLDVGCGTGEHTLLAAALGLEATGIDVAEPALATARRKAAERGLTAHVFAWDATRLHILGLRWQTVLDCGVFHVFNDADRTRYVASLSTAVEPGGRYHMLVFSDRQSGAFGPRRVSEAEIRASFAEGWSIISIEPTILETNAGFDPADDGTARDDGGPSPAVDRAAGTHGAKAWLSVIERL
jgi:SAM-dependent methyltransferase/GNAT superfamily N-acetyltransferase